jgi:hypothetical protein
MIPIFIPNTNGYSGQMISNARLNLQFDVEDPIELVDFTLALGSFGNQYQRFIEWKTRKSNIEPDYLKESVKLCVTKIESNCKRKLFTCLIAALPGVVFAQTNFFALLECANARYTNATISQVTPAYATVITAGGIAQVPMDQMPRSIQEQYQYSSNTAAQFLVEKKRKAEAMRAATNARLAADAKARSAMMSQSKVLTVTAIPDEASNGGLPLCVVTSGSGGGQTGRMPPGRVLLSDLPVEVLNYFQQSQQLKTDIANLESAAITVTAKATVYNSDGSVDSFGSQLNSQIAADNALYQAKQDRKESLERMNKRLAEMKESQFENTTIRAYFSGQTFGNYEIWNCIGMASPNQ